MWHAGKVLTHLDRELHSLVMCPARLMQSKHEVIGCLRRIITGCICQHGRIEGFAMVILGLGNGTVGYLEAQRSFQGSIVPPPRR